MSYELCNIGEDFTREIRHVLLFDAASFTFNQNLRALTPDPNAALVKLHVAHPSGYNRKISLKEQNHNDYFDMKVTFPVYELSKEVRLKLISMHKKRKYVVALVSAQEMLVVGNHREPFSLTIDDDIVDNGTGKDLFTISLTGQTIIFPTLGKITEKFRVLMFLPPTN